MLQYDLVAFGWQVTILLIFTATILFLIGKEKIKKMEVEESKFERIERTTSDTRRNTIHLSERIDLQGCEIQRISDIVNSLRGKDTRKDVDRLKELFEELREDSLKTSTKLADHQQDITALKTNKALS